MGCAQSSGTPPLPRMANPCSAPAPGRYKLHVRGRQLGADGGMAPIRGSPFSINAADPWEQQVLAGAAPARRAGATLTSLGSDLVLFGGDKSLAAVCHAPAAGAAEQQPWQWVPTGETERPVARKGHAAAALPASRLLVCGGTSLEGEPADLADVRVLHTEGSRLAGASWAWEAAAALQPKLHPRADGSLVPTERAGHCAAVLGGHTLVVFGGEHHGQLLQELCLLDLSSKVGGCVRLKARYPIATACCSSVVDAGCSPAALPTCLPPIAPPLHRRPAGWSRLSRASCPVLGAAQQPPLLAILLSSLAAVLPMSRERLWPSMTCTCWRWQGPRWCAAGGRRRRARCPRLAPARCCRSRPRGACCCTVAAMPPAGR